jgi:hypothetical protein
MSTMATLLSMESSYLKKIKDGDIIMVAHHHPYPLNF